MAELVGDALVLPLAASSSSPELGLDYTLGHPLHPDLPNAIPISERTIQEGFTRDASVSWAVFGDPSAQDVVYLVSGRRGTDPRDETLLYRRLVANILAEHPEGLQVRMCLLGPNVTVERSDTMPPSAQLTANLEHNDHRVEDILTEDVEQFIDAGGRSIRAIAVSASARAVVRAIGRGTRTARRELDEPLSVALIVPNTRRPSDEFDSAQPDAEPMANEYADAAAAIGGLLLVILAEHDAIFSYRRSMAVVRALGSVASTFVITDRRRNLPLMGAHQMTAVSIFAHPEQMLRLLGL